MSNDIDTAAIEQAFSAYRGEMLALENRADVIRTAMDTAESRFHREACALLAATEWMSTPKVGDILVEAGWKRRLNSPRRREPALVAFVVCSVSFYRPNREVWSRGNPAENVEKFARFAIGKKVKAYAVNQDGRVGKREGRPWTAREYVGRVKTAVGEDGQPFVDLTRPVVVEVINKEVAALLPAWAQINA